MLTLLALLVATDFIIALLPIVFIRQLNRPVRDKVVLSILMGCGLLATAVGIGKIVCYQRNAAIKDLFYQGVYVGIFTFVPVPSFPGY
jgi:hypothetical protein